MRENTASLQTDLNPWSGGGGSGGGVKELYDRGYQRGDEEEFTFVKYSIQLTPTEGHSDVWYQIFEWIFFGRRACTQDPSIKIRHIPTRHSIFILAVKRFRFLGNLFEQFARIEIRSPRLATGTLYLWHNVSIQMCYDVTSQFYLIIPHFSFNFRFYSDITKQVTYTSCVNS